MHIKNQAKLTHNRSLRLQAEPKQCRFHRFSDHKYFFVDRKKLHIRQEIMQIQKSQSPEDLRAANKQ
jgi:hypothetical protein